MLVDINDKLFRSNYLNMIRESTQVTSNNILDIEDNDIIHNYKYGFVQLRKCDGCYWIVNLYINYDYRRQYNGIKLVHYIEKKYGNIITSINRFNKDAVNFFRYIGYIEQGYSLINRNQIIFTSFYQQLFQQIDKTNKVFYFL